MPDTHLDFWFDFASTYSYPAAMRIDALAKDAGVAVRYRPFLLGPIFETQGWTTSPFNVYEAKGRHMWRDLERLCADLSLPFKRPDPFPQSSVLAARVALLGLADDWGETFCRRMFEAEFAHGCRIDDGTTIRDILAELGVDPEAVVAQAQSDAIKGQLRQQTGEAVRLGIFGSPTFVTTDGELFWGNDRLERALQWTSDGRS